MEKKQIVMREDLLSANIQGIFPYPDETETSFLQRMLQRKKLQQDRNTILQRAYGKKPYEVLKESAWKKTVQTMQSHFDVGLIWPLAAVCDSNLRFYEVGATFFFEGNYILQIKKKKIGSSLQEEVLLHEAIHIARQDLKSIKYEEIFAYSLSESKLRKTLGPLFRTPKESLFFGFIYLLMPLLFYYFEISIFWMFVYLLPIAFLLARLVIARKKLYKCVHKLRLFFGIDAWKVSFRLLDKEIDFFSKSSIAAIAKYIHNNSSFRWKQIRVCYERNFSN